MQGCFNFPINLQPQWRRVANIDHEDPGGCCRKISLVLFHHDDKLTQMEATINASKLWSYMQRQQQQEQKQQQEEEKDNTARIF